MSFRAKLGMRRAGDQHHGVGHEEAAETVCTLIGINKLDRLMLAHAAHHVVAVDQAKGKFAAGDQIRAVAVAGRELDAIVFERVHEGLRALIAPKDEQRGNLRRRRTEQRVGDDRLAAPLRVRIGKHRIGLCADAFLLTMRTRARAAKPVQ